MDKVNVTSELNKINEFWKPKIIGGLNDHLVKIAKLEGEFLWHKHDNEDEMFMVMDGTLIIKFRDKDVVVEKSEFIIIPKGVDHLPVASKPVSIMLIEPKETVNTGNIENERTVYFD